MKTTQIIPAFYLTMLRPRRWCVALLAGLLLLLAPEKVPGAAIQGVGIAAFSSQYSSGTDVRSVTNLVTGTGLFGEFHSNLQPGGGMWLTLPSTTGAHRSAFVTFDLGAVRTVHQMKVWNCNESGQFTRRGIQTAHISVSTNGVNFVTNLFNQPFTRAPGTFANDFAQTIAMGGVEARYVRINVLQNYATSPADNRVGLSKVRFIDNSVPPTLNKATRSVSGDRVTLRFSESVSPATANQVTNYAISGPTGVTVLSAAVDFYTDRVILQTSGMASNQAYTVTAQNVQDANSVISITNTTLAIEPETVLWLQADAGVVADGSGKVSQWLDQSGAGNSAAQAVVAAQPTVVSNVLNSHNVLRFDGSTNSLAVASAASLVTAQDVSLFAVVTPQSFVGANTIVGKAVSGANLPAPFELNLNQTTGAPRIFRGNSTGGAGVTGGSSLAAGSSYLVTGIVSGTNALTFLNGNFNGAAVALAGVEDAGTPVRIGRREDAASWFNGDLAEVLYIRGAVSESERLALDIYFGRKYGLPVPNIGPPQVLVQPTNYTAYFGEPAFFLARFTNGLLPRVIQWYQDPDLPLLGETNETLTVIANTNTFFYATATNADGLVQTVSAPLTVIPLTPPIITQQPQPGSRTIYVHQPATFTVAATGQTLSYQWYRNGTPVAGATQSAIAITNASTVLAGNYSVTITNSSGVTNSGVATLTVLTPPAGSYLAAVLAANPVVYYRFSEVNSGTNLAFNYGNLGASHDGVFEGTYSGLDGPVPPTFPIFESTNLSFNNETLVDGGVKVPAITLNTNGGAHATFVAWIYKDVAQVPTAPLIYSRMTGESCGIGSKANAGNDQVFYQWNDTFHNFVTGLTIPNGQWTFVAAVVEPGQGTVYLNSGSGMLSATNITPHGLRPVINASYVGWDTFQGTRRWFGRIDEPMIFDRALAPAEIHALYAAAFAPSVVLDVARMGNNLVLTWPSGTLQEAEQVGGPYTSLVGTNSPHVITPDQPQRYYRVLVQ